MSEKIIQLNEEVVKVELNVLQLVKAIAAAIITVNLLQPQEKSALTSQSSKESPLRQQSLNDIAAEKVQLRKP